MTDLGLGETDQTRVPDGRAGGRDTGGPGAMGFQQEQLGLPAARGARRGRRGRCVGHTGHGKRAAFFKLGGWRGQRHL